MWITIPEGGSQGLGGRSAEADARMTDENTRCHAGDLVPLGVCGVLRRDGVLLQEMDSPPSSISPPRPLPRQDRCAWLCCGEIEAA